MKIEILNDKENPLLNRREIKFRATYADVTPKFADVKKELLNELKTDEKLTILDNIKPEYGTRALIGYVKVYADEKSVGIELKHKIKKNFGGGEKKEGEEAQKKEGTE